MTIKKNGRMKLNYSELRREWKNRVKASFSRDFHGNGIVFAAWGLGV